MAPRAHRLSSSVGTWSSAACAATSCSSASMIAIGSRAVRPRFLLCCIVLLTSLSSWSYLVRELLADLVESASDSANGFRRQAGRDLEVYTGEVFAARVDVRGQFWIGSRALL